MKSPKREMQQLLDYLRHKVLRRIKKRRKRLQESALKLAEKWLKHKIRRPQYADGKDHNYDDWINALASKWGVSRLELEKDDYDYKNYYYSNPTEAERHLVGNAHFPDTYKYPTHPTFSTYSVYSGRNGNIVGGTWVENNNALLRWTYLLSPDLVANNWNIHRTLDYASNAEDDGFKITDSRGRYPVINGVIENGILPTINVYPAYADGKDDDVIYAEPTLTIYRLMKDIGLDPETGEYVDNTTGLRGSLRLPEFTVNWDRRNNRMMTSDEVTENFYRKHIPYSSSFDGNLITAPTDWLVEKVIGPSFNALLSGFANYGTTPQQLSDPNYQAFMQGQTQQLGEGLSYAMPSRYLDTGNTTLNFAMDMLAGKYAPKVIKSGIKYVGRKTAPIWMPWMLERGIRNATKTGEIRVGEDYFNSPYNWYRVAALPEKWALEEAGKNITSRDSGTSPELSTYADDYRISRMDYDHTGRNNMGNNVLYALRRGDDGFLYLNKTENIDPFGFMGRKTGSAHGNRSLASWGIPWQGSIAGSGSIFPRGIIEGGANMIDFGKTRSVYLPRYIEDVPIGSRVGFKTGEMPMDNLSWFLRQPDGTYSYEPIIPEKRILLNKPQTSLQPLLGTQDFSYKGSADIKELYKLKMADDVTQYIVGNDAGIKAPSRFEDGRYARGTRIPMPDESWQIFTNSVVPRLVRSEKHSLGLSTDARIKAIQDWVDEQKKKAGYYTTDDYTYDASIPDGLWSAGYYSPVADEIILRRSTDPNWAMPHEWRHKTDKRFPLGFSDKLVLRDAYGHMKLALKEDSDPTVVKYADNAEAEYPTTNGDARIQLLGKQASKYTPIELQDMIIDKMPKERVIEAIRESNGYGRRLIEYLERNNKLTDELVNAFRTAMKQVGSAVLPIYILDQLINQNSGNLNNSLNKPVFKHGKDSGIHIKPKNRGKFNATKKRTGKTTALLAHSKNPLTRKRAIFALNAKKWKH